MGKDGGRNRFQPRAGGHLMQDVDEDSGEDIARPRNIALSLLVAYVTGRTKNKNDFKLTEIAKKIGGKNGRKEFSDFDTFRRGRYDPDRHQVGRLETILRTALKNIDTDILVADAVYLRPILDAALPSFKLPAKRGNHLHEDFAFVRSFGLGLDMDKAGAAGEMLAEHMAGHWWVLKLGTRGEGEAKPINVSLLRVHALRYRKLYEKNGRLETPYDVETLIPHFTMRSLKRRKMGNEAPVCMDKGWLVDVGKELVFVGSRTSDTTLKTRMVVLSPLHMESGNERNPAGIILRPSSGGISVSGPVVLCRIPSTHEMREMESEGNTENSVAYSEALFKRRHELMQAVDMHDEETALGALSPAAPKAAVAAAIGQLMAARDAIRVRGNSKGGNYSVPEAD